MIIVISAVSMAGGGADKAKPAETTTTTQEATTTEETTEEETVEETQGYVIKYEIETNGSTANVSWMTKGFNVSQKSAAPSGWTEEVVFDNEWDALGINMNAQLDGSGTVTCRMYANGELISENTSEGEFVMVTCSK